MSIRAAELVGTDVSNSDQRWAQWVARGAAHDRALKGRAMGVAVVVACSLTVWLASRLMF